MLTRQVRRIKLTNYEGVGNIYLWNPKGLRFMSQTDASDPNTEEKPIRTLKKWRPHYDTQQKLATNMKIFDRGLGRPSTDFLVIMNSPWDLSRSGITKWWNRKKLELEIYDQRFIQKRHEILGSNLAAAHFLVHRGGKIKFMGQSDWVEKDKHEDYKLPVTYEPNYLVEAIDANGINLHYDGLLNMQHLLHLKFLSLKGCRPIDDWCLDKISSQYPKLECLDISNCERVTERGLEALYRMHSLKTLVVTNYEGSAAFELTCMMLEDCNPNIKCDIRSPEPKDKENGK